MGSRGNTAYKQTVHDAGPGAPGLAGLAGLPDTLGFDGDDDALGALGWSLPRPTEVTAADCAGVGGGGGAEGRAGAARGLGRPDPHLGKRRRPAAEGAREGADAGAGDEDTGIDMEELMRHVVNPAFETTPGAQGVRLSTGDGVSLNDWVMEHAVLAHIDADASALSGNTGNAAEKLRESSVLFACLLARILANRAMGAFSEADSLRDSAREQHVQSLVVSGNALMARAFASIDIDEVAKTPNGPSALGGFIEVCVIAFQKYGAQLNTVRPHDLAVCQFLVDWMQGRLELGELGRFSLAVQALSFLHLRQVVIAPDDADAKRALLIAALRFHNTCTSMSLFEDTTTRQYYVDAVRLLAIAYDHSRMPLEAARTLAALADKLASGPVTQQTVGAIVDLLKEVGARYVAAGDHASALQPFRQAEGLYLAIHPLSDADRQSLELVRACISLCTSDAGGDVGGAKAAPSYFL